MTGRVHRKQPLDLTNLSLRVLNTAKRKAWDTPDLYLSLSSSALSSYERAYLRLKRLLVTASQSVGRGYVGLKAGAER